MSHHLKTFVRDYFDAISGRDKPAALVNKYIADNKIVEHWMSVDQQELMKQLQVGEMV